MPFEIDDKNEADLDEVGITGDIVLLPLGPAEKFQY